MSSTKKLYDKVWVNGCFDILHPGHVRMLKYAKSLGHFLMVGIDTDETVREAKGSNRPFFSAADRMEMVSSLECVDQVILFHKNAGLIDTISRFNPDCIVDGEEYRGYVVRPDTWEGDIIYFPRIEVYSTTKVLKNVDNE